jgi:hypothetical protein
MRTIKQVSDTSDVSESHKRHMVAEPVVYTEEDCRFEQLVPYQVLCCFLALEIGLP